MRDIHRRDAEYAEIFLCALCVSVVMLFLPAAQLKAQTQVPDAAQFVGSPKGQPLTGETLDRRTDEIATLLRCPVCQGLAVADSPAEMAVNMKRQVRDLLARGYTEEQILSYFEQSYGQFVLLKPKFEGLNQLVWVLPIAALIIGIVLVVVKMKKLEKGKEAEDPYLAQVRELVGRDKP